MLRDKNTDADGLCDDERIYYLGDANFNVTTLVNTGGDVVERYVYSPYGVLTIYDATWANIRSTSSYANAYTYTGRQLDVETALYYYRARLYAPQLGRFCSRDPIGYEGGINLCAYVGGNPVTYTDPAGLQNPGQGFYPGPLPGQPYVPGVHPPQAPAPAPVQPPGCPSSLSCTYSCPLHCARRQYCPDNDWQKGVMVICNCNVNTTVTCELRDGDSGCPPTYTHSNASIYEYGPFYSYISPAFLLSFCPWWEYITVSVTGGT